MNLNELIKNSNNIALVGMCKNAGKTTVLNSLIQEAGSSSSLALTSIGRDGEATDIVTQTSKPRLYVYKDTLIATATNVLPFCDATLDILDTSDINTPLGEVIIARAVSDGYVQLAGPSTVEGLRRASRSMRNFGAERIIIDGAVSRKSLSFPGLCDSAILSTGASYNPNMQTVIHDTAITAGLLTLPKATAVFDKSISAKYTVKHDEDVLFVDHRQELFRPLKNIRHGAVIRIAGAVTDSSTTPILESGIKDSELVAEDSSKLLLSNHTLQKLKIRGMRLTVETPITLLAVTVNPFSAYGSGFDSDAFFNGICVALSKMHLFIIDAVRKVVIRP